MNQRRLGIAYALVAYTLWGLMPLYLHAMRAVPPLELLSHRIVWACAFLAIVLAVGRQLAWIRELWRRPRIVLTFLLSAAVLSINWFVYIVAVDTRRVLDASLGYFINPLVSVLLGVLVLKERLRPLQWMAVGLAGAGVVWLTVSAARLPWIGLTLAVSFGIYGLLRKTALLDALPGLALETALLLPLAGAYLAWVLLRGGSGWGAADSTQRGLLLAAGPVTAIPLLSFAGGARRIPLSLLGILQYIGPSLQLLLGIWVFHEPFGTAKLVGFALIWLSVLTFLLEGLHFTRARAASA